MITQEYIGASGVKYLFEYEEVDSFSHLLQERVKQCYGVCFCGDKFLIVNNVDRPGYFALIGGSVEEGEHPDDTLIREIKEESNMKVLHYQPIGYQKVVDTRGIQEPFYQLRYFCIAEPYGPFESDPAGKVTEVVMTDYENYKKYFDWGEIGEAIIQKALRLKKEWEN